MSIFQHRYSACANELATTCYYLLLNVSCAQILHKYCTNIARLHKQATRHNWATRHTLSNTGAIEQQTRGVENARFSRSWRLCSYNRQKIDKQRKWQKETHFIANKDGMLGLGVLYGQLGKFIVMLSICGMHHFCCFFTNAYYHF